MNSSMNKCFCGIDVGLRESHAAIMENRKVVSIFKVEADQLSDLSPCFAAGIDAPLSLPQEGTLRECERDLIKMGIRLFPSGADFFKKVAEKGMQFSTALEAEEGIEVFEVYPYATRSILKIAPNSKKREKGGRAAIVTDLNRYTEIKEDLNHNEIDAVIAALTVSLYYEGHGRILEGADGSLLIPD
ncbi:MAG: DUF429 domain-containing protein [Archaeoglobaceae archaeon]